MGPSPPTSGNTPSEVSRGQAQVLYTDLSLSASIITTKPWPYPAWPNSRGLLTCEGVRTWKMMPVS